MPGLIDRLTRSKPAGYPATSVRNRCSGVDRYDDTPERGEPPFPCLELPPRARGAHVLALCFSPATASYSYPMAQLALHYVNVIVTDLPRSLDFYQKLFGLTII